MNAHELSGNGAAAEAAVDVDESAMARPDLEPAVCASGREPVIRSREEHSISRQDIDPEALKVLYRLARNNYTAYLVGGGVRDLLLGRKPKDFDISTNAKPEQIRALFRNCILIGRRFRLAHIRFGEKIIETSTFRTTPKCEADPNDPDADLFQRDDNLFGTPEEDALRRDFTVNGLFYDIESFSIIDYVGGSEDLAARRIRSIGDANIRFREDPVRMVRAVRFASRLNFTIDPETEAAMHRHADELTRASPARLLEEITRLFAFSSGERAVRLLYETGLLAIILPEVAEAIDHKSIDTDLFWRRLEALDTGDTVLPDATPALIFATLLLEPLKLHLGKDWDFDTTPKFKCDKVRAFLDPLAQRLRFPRKLVDRIVHMYFSQHRFSAAINRGKRGSISNFVTQDAFHESLALAEIVLAAENGQHSRLKLWRDMLAERMYGRDDSPGGRAERHDRDRDRDRHRSNGNRVKVEVPEKEDDGDDAANSPADELGRKLSRSARRRPNKRLRRHQNSEERPIPSPEITSAAKGEAEEPRAAAQPKASANTAAPTTPPPATSNADATADATATLTAPTAEAPSASRSSRSRRGKGRKKAEASAEPSTETAGVAPVEQPKRAAPAKAESGVRAVESAAATESRKTSESSRADRQKRGRGRRTAAKASAQADGEPVQPPHIPDEALLENPTPLTAASFWSKPAPEPEPEPVKKGRAKKAKGDETKKKTTKAKAAKADKGAAKEKAPAPDKPLTIDKADEADTPMHWLDEI
ncbi:MAG: polynucleotide adenylyltransferase PcnB [Planctomycetes bacterium]|nr:polynucleotide adenylyltransferase PcnB [Planctomycetota bacterium]